MSLHEMMGFVTGEKGKTMAEYKAWLVREKGEFCATVVFAETRGKARERAMHTDACEDVDFINIEVHRLKDADKYYKPGKSELDWFNSEDRVAMVKDCGFTCIPDAHSAENCEVCPAKDLCDDYIGMEDEEDG